MNLTANPRILVLCTVSTGFDAVAEVRRRGVEFVAVVGVHPAVADTTVISGYVDVAEFSKYSGIPFHYVRSYILEAEEDQSLLSSLDFDLIWVAGWQRLVPPWLIDASKLGVLGGHGSPDGIHGGRGRSPQNWALLLGCERFDLALFKITYGVDEGPVIAQRSFFYREQDDIRISYYRSSLAMADMVCEVLGNPDRLTGGMPQPTDAYYYPQRLPHEGVVDWTLPRRLIALHCRALSRPYPGLKTGSDGVEVTLWECQDFDDVIEAESGTISHCFYSGEFLVNCRDGRVLVRQWTATNADWHPLPRMKLVSQPFVDQLEAIVRRHEEKYPNQPVSPRIKRWLTAPC